MRQYHYLVCPAPPGHGYVYAGYLARVTAEEAARIEDGDLKLAAEFDVYAHERGDIARGVKPWTPTEIVRAPEPQVEWGPGGHQEVWVPGWEEYAVDPLPPKK